MEPMNATTWILLWIVVAWLAIWHFTTLPKRNKKKKGR